MRTWEQPNRQFGLPSKDAVSRIRHSLPRGAAVRLLNADRYR